MWGRNGNALKGNRTLAVIGMCLIALLGIGTLSACGSNDDNQYSQVCQDKNTGQRVDDNRCNERRDSYGWYYFPPYYGMVPGIGSRLSGGSYSYPSGSPLRTRIPSSGFTTPKRPTFDNSKMKPVPPNFKPPTSSNKSGATSPKSSSKK